jgi:hypothetical protein
MHKSFREGIGFTPTFLKKKIAQNIIFTDKKSLNVKKQKFCFRLSRAAAFLDAYSLDHKT